MNPFRDIWHTIHSVYFINFFLTKFSTNFFISLLFFYFSSSLTVAGERLPAKGCRLNCVGVRSRTNARRIMNSTICYIYQPLTAALESRFIAIDICLSKALPREAEPTCVFISMLIPSSVRVYSCLAYLPVMFLRQDEENFHRNFTTSSCTT